MQVSLCYDFVLLFYNNNIKVGNLGKNLLDGYLSVIYIEIFVWIGVLGKQLLMCLNRD
jgi:hypothetical protein